MADDYGVLPVHFAEQVLASTSSCSCAWPVVSITDTQLVFPGDRMGEQTDARS